MGAVALEAVPSAVPGGARYALPHGDGQSASPAMLLEQQQPLATNPHEHQHQQQLRMDVLAGVVGKRQGDEPSPTPSCP